MSFIRSCSFEQDKVMDSIWTEIKVLAKLRHPYIIKFLGVTEHASYFNIFLEWMPGKLYYVGGSEI